MKKFYFKKSIFLLILVPSLNSCEPILVPDPIDPRLPKYTENGNNVAGALVNNTIWESSVHKGWFIDGDEPMFSANNNSLVIEFFGKINGNTCNFSFHLTEQSIFNFQQLKLLENKKMILDGKVQFASFSGYISDLSEFENYSSGIGQIYFRKINFIDSLNQAIISGTFGFTVINSENIPLVVTYGRFDYKIENDINFHFYNIEKNIR